MSIMTAGPRTRCCVRFAADIQQAPDGGRVVHSGRLEGNAQACHSARTAPGWQYNSFEQAARPAGGCACIAIPGARSRLQSLGPNNLSQESG
jgi:hypothetical protein